MPKQMQLDLRGDVFLRELELFEMLYGVRCVESASMAARSCVVEQTKEHGCYGPIAAPGRWKSCHFPQSAFND